jgi:hypothetical protein
MLAVAGSLPAQAQDWGRFGVSGGFQFDDSAFIAQARLQLYLDRNLAVVPAVGYEFENDDVVIDIDGHYTVWPSKTVDVYGLGGMNYGDGDLGLNLGVGAEFATSSRLRLFSELKYVAFGWKGVALTVGVYF